MNLIPPILFIFQKEMSLTLTEQGVIAFIISSAGVFAQPLIGLFADKKGSTIKSICRHQHFLIQYSHFPF